MTVTVPAARAGCGAGAVAAVGNGDFPPAKFGNGAVTPECGTVSVPSAGLPQT